MNTTQGLAELVAHWRGFADVFASLDGPTNNALTVRMREMADELEAALSQQPAVEKVAWRKIGQGVSAWRLLPVPDVCLEDEMRGWYRIEYAHHPAALQPRSAA